MRVTPLFSARLVLYRLRIPQLASVGLLAALLTSCGGSGGSQPPVLSGNTAVTVLLTGTANDQLSQFGITLNSLTLTSQSGKIVTLLNTPQTGELIHLNGNVEPFFTVTVPQDIYSSASAMMGTTSFTCATLEPTGDIAASTYGYGYVPTNQITVNLPTPITITGSAMGLSLDMLVTPSATFPSSCYVDGIVPYSIDPTFNVSPLSFSSPVAEPSLKGQIVSIGPTDGSFSVQLVDGQTISFNTSDSTVYQGVSGFQALTVGTFVDMDASIQTDGSQLASRISVLDTNTTQLTMATGPVLSVDAIDPILFEFQRQQQGFLPSSEGYAIGNYFDFGSAEFQISGSLTNLQSLPFVPSFTGSTIFAGQNVYITTHAPSLEGYTPASTVTLMLQTINGIVNAISTEGSFTTYTVSLAAYDLMPTFAVQQGQTTVLTDPNTVVVYADNNTRLLNSQPLMIGSVARFDGMLFNDSGTMRFDCDQVNDGVTVQPNSQIQRTHGLSSRSRGIVVHHYLQHEAISVE